MSLQSKRKNSDFEVNITESELVVQDTNWSKKNYNIKS